MADLKPPIGLFTQDTARLEEIMSELQKYKKLHKDLKEENSTNIENLKSIQTKEAILQQSIKDIDDKQDELVNDIIDNLEYTSLVNYLDIKNIIDKLIQNYKDKSEAEINALNQIISDNYRNIYYDLQKDNAECYEKNLHIIDFNGGEANEELKDINRILNEISNYSPEYIEQRKEKDKLSVNLLFSSILAKIDIKDSEKYTKLIEIVLNIFDEIYRVKHKIQNSLFYLYKSRFESRLLQRLIECLLNNYINHYDNLINIDKIEEKITDKLSKPDVLQSILCEFIPNLKGYLIKKELLNKIKIESRISYNIYDEDASVEKLKFLLESNSVATELFNMKDNLEYLKSAVETEKIAVIKRLQNKDNGFNFIEEKNKLWSVYEKAREYPNSEIGVDGKSFKMNEEFYNTFMQLRVIKDQFKKISDDFFCVKKPLDPGIYDNHAGIHFSKVWLCFDFLRSEYRWERPGVKIQITDPKDLYKSRKVKYGRKIKEVATDDGGTTDEYLLYNVFTGEPLIDSDNNYYIYNFGKQVPGYEGDPITELPAFENEDAPDLFDPDDVKKNKKARYIMGDFRAVYKEVTEYFTKINDLFDHIGGLIDLKINDPELAENYKILKVSWKELNENILEAREKKDNFFKCYHEDSGKIEYDNALAPNQSLQPENYFDKKQGEMCRSLEIMNTEIDLFFEELETSGLAKDNVFKFMKFLVTLTDILNQLKISSKNPFEVIKNVMSFNSSQLFITEAKKFTEEISFDDIDLFEDGDGEYSFMISNEKIEIIKSELRRNLPVNRYIDDIYQRWLEQIEGGDAEREGLKGGADPAPDIEPAQVVEPAPKKISPQPEPEPEPAPTPAPTQPTPASEAYTAKLPLSDDGDGGEVHSENAPIPQSYNEFAKKTIIKFDSTLDMEQTINEFIKNIPSEIKIESIKVNGETITQEDLRRHNITPEILKFEMIEPIQSRDQGDAEEPELEPVALETPSPAVAPAGGSGVAHGGADVGAATSPKRYEFILKGLKGLISDIKNDVEQMNGIDTDSLEVEIKNLKYIDFLDSCIREYLNIRPHNLNIIRGIYVVLHNEGLFNKIEEDMKTETNSMDPEDVDFHYFDELFIEKTIDFLISNDILISEDNRVFTQYLFDKYSINNGTKILLEKIVNIITNGQTVNSVSVEHFKTINDMQSLLNIIERIDAEAPASGGAMMGGGDGARRIREALTKGGLLEPKYIPIRKNLVYEGKNLISRMIDSKEIGNKDILAYHFYSNIKELFKTFDHFIQQDYRIESYSSMDRLIGLKFKNLISQIIQYQINPSLKDNVFETYRNLDAKDINYDINEELEDVVELLDDIRYKVYSVTYEINGTKTYEDFMRIYEGGDDDHKEAIKDKIKGEIATILGKEPEDIKIVGFRPGSLKIDFIYIGLDNIETGNIESGSRFDIDNSLHFNLEDKNIRVHHKLDPELDYLEGKVNPKGSTKFDKPIIVEQVVPSKYSDYIPGEGVEEPKPKPQPEPEPAPEFVEELPLGVGNLPEAGWVPGAIAEVVGDGQCLFNAIGHTNQDNKEAHVIREMVVSWIQENWDTDILENVPHMKKANVTEFKVKDAVLDPHSVEQEQGLKDVYISDMSKYDTYATEVEAAIVGIIMGYAINIYRRKDGTIEFLHPVGKVQYGIVRNILLKNINEPHRAHYDIYYPTGKEPNAENKQPKQGVTPPPPLSAFRVLAPPPADAPAGAAGEPPAPAGGPPAAGAPPAGEPPSPAPAGAPPP